MFEKRDEIKERMQSPNGGGYEGPAQSDAVSLVSSFEVLIGKVVERTIGQTNAELSSLHTQL